MSIRSSARSSSNEMSRCPFPRLIAIARRCSSARKYFSAPSRKERRRPFSLRTASRLLRSNSCAKNPWVMSSASSGGRPCRRRKAKMGRQYVRQSFSSASCAAGDSPWASSTTLQCVVANATPPCCPLASVAAVEVTSWGPALTARSKEKIAPKASLLAVTAAAFAEATASEGEAVSLLHSLSSRATCVKINDPWLCDCRNRIIRTLSA